VRLSNNRETGGPCLALVQSLFYIKPPPKAIFFLGGGGDADQ